MLVITMQMVSIYPFLACSLYFSLWLAEDYSFLTLSFDNEDQKNATTKHSNFLMTPHSFYLFVCLISVFEA